MSNRENNSLKGIAIIGMVCRFPEAKNIDEFWQNLSQGRESISFFTDDELENAGEDAAVLRNPNYVKAAPILSDIDMFDASFFDISPREAEVMDPQQRLFLECAWEALEHAGYDPEREKRWIGVYAGSNLSTYFHYNLSSHHDLFEELSTQLFIGNDKDYVPTRVSYKLNLKGPSLNINTACSTSLVAIHAASRSLLNYECDMALAGGITIKVPHLTGYLYQKDGISSPDGHCRAFDANAGGTVMGSGVGIVVLKRLKDALADGDHIYAVLKGSAINNDGSGKVAFTAPSVVGQAKVIAEAQAIAKFDPETITYIETHGTGTKLGDPIEISALKKVFNAHTQKKGFCAIGSVKTNVGHLNSAAGVAGLIKAVLALQHKMIPPSLHFETPNPTIDFENSPFYVNTKLQPWETHGIPRRAGVSSFGFGGTNAHVLLEEAPPKQPSSSSRPWQLLLISAKTNSALETATAQLLEYLQHSSQPLADVAYTLQVGRRAFDHRRVLVCQDLDSAIQALSTPDSPPVLTQHHKPAHRPIVFMFPGQGTQYVNMGRQLYEHEPTFAQHIDHCATLVQPLLGLDIRELLYPQTEQLESAQPLLQLTALTQVALFVVEYALAQLWMEWGVHPTAMIGHSIGEYVAATVAGVFSLPDALEIVAFRGQLMQQLPPGSMLAVSLSADALQPLLSDSLSLAAINAPNACVVSGSIDAISSLQLLLTEQGVACRRLLTNHAFHSSITAELLPAFIQKLQQFHLQPPQIPFISNVTGSWIDSQQATSPDYWATHLRQTVLFDSGLQLLLQESAQIFLEVGPGSTLSKFASRHPLKHPHQLFFTCLAHPRQQFQSDVAFLLRTLGQLWLAGVSIDWSAFSSHEFRHRLPLPTYPFERHRYWIEPKSSLPSSSPNSIKLDIKQNISDWLYIPSWKRSLLSHTHSSFKANIQNKPWLIFADEHGLGLQLANRLSDEGKDVILVKIGEEFSHVSNGNYTIHPHTCEHYQTLFQELISFEKVPENIAYLWSLDSLSHSQEGEFLEFLSLLFLVQSLNKHRITVPLQLWVVTNQTQVINGAEIVKPDKATILGLCKAIPQEYPQIACRNIDVVLPQKETWQEKKLVNQILNEFTTLSADAVVAYRSHYRWIQSFESVRSQSDISDIEVKIPLKKHATYLIVGGLESIGGVLAEYLAETFQAKLIFLENSVLPCKQEYVNWLENHGYQNDISRKIIKQQELEKLGAEVIVISVDMTNDEHVRTILTPEQINSIHGVIYSINHNHENLFYQIHEIGESELEKTLYHQRKEIVALDRIFQEKQLDFCIFLSSLSSILGGFGQTISSATHLFLDSLVYQHNQATSVPWLTINWDRWQLASSKAQETPWQTSGAELAIKPTEGLETFQRILSLGEVNQVIVSTVNLPARFEHLYKHKHQIETRASAQKDSSSYHSRPNLSNPYVLPTNNLEQQIAQMWQEILGIEKVGIYDDFFELGGDSLIAAQLISRWRSSFPVELSVRDFLTEETTVAKQAEMLEALLIEKINDLSEEEVQVLLASK